MSQSYIELKYKEEAIVQIRKQTAGQTKTEASGCYASKEQKDIPKYFLKFPDIDKSPEAFFAEGFTGKLLTKFKQYDLIPKQYHDTFVCADVHDFGQPYKFGLVQPNVKFKELFTYFNIGTSSGSAGDRSPVYEMFFGSGQYKRAFDELQGLKNGLPFCAFINMVLSNYSGFHSGNIVVLEGSEPDLVAQKPRTQAADEKDGEQNDEKQDLSSSMILIEAPRFASIDQGASLRNIGDSKNQDVLNPLEDKSFKGVTTKGYIKFYKDYPGLFEASAKIGKEFFIAKLIENGSGEALLNKIILEVIDEMPCNMFTLDQARKIQASIGISSFAEAFSGNGQKNRLFARDLAKILYQRIAASAKLTEIELFKQDHDQLAIKNLHVEEEKRQIQEELERQKLEFKKQTDMIIAEHKKSLEEKKELTERLEARLKEAEEKTNQIQQELKNKNEEDEKTLVAISQFQKKDLPQALYQAIKSNYQTQKTSKYSTAFTCFGVGIISGCVVTGAIWYAGGICVVGFMVTSLACLFPIAAIIGGIYYCYRAAQISEVITTANTLQQSLNSLFEEEKEGKQLPKDQFSVHCVQLFFKISELTVSTRIKQQLYQKLESEIKNKRAEKLKASAICDALLAAEQANQSSYCGLFGRRPNTSVIQALTEYKTKIQQKNTL